MKVFITGATGFVGRHIAGRLAEDGHELKCLVRDTEAEASWFLKGIGAEVVEGDIHVSHSLATGAAGCDAVIHLVGIILERPEISFEQVHVEGTRNMLVAADAAGIKHFIHMSALGTRAGAGAAYHRTKWDAEEVVRTSGLDYTIIRPSIIYGPGGEFINMLMKQVRLSPVLPVIGNGRYRMQPISVDDVAACFSKSLTTEAAVNKIYEIGGPEALSYNEMVDTICRVMGKKRVKAHVPAAMVRPVAWFSEKVMPRPLVTRDQLDMLLADNVCDITAMRDELGVKPVSFADGLRSML
ncbi:MAG: complex I NDUFA9 subunit family protein [Thermoleophilia bacterium]|nr:complex I NDUFA9 subunit family protein [Thermoleophilia bacterium]